MRWRQLRPRAPKEAIDTDCQPTRTDTSAWLKLHRVAGNRLVQRLLAPLAGEVSDSAPAPQERAPTFAERDMVCREVSEVLALRRAAEEAEAKAEGAQHRLEQDSPQRSSVSPLHIFDAAESTADGARAAIETYATFDDRLRKAVFDHAYPLGSIRKILKALPASDAVGSYRDVVQDLIARVNYAETATTPTANTTEGDSPDS